MEIYQWLLRRNGYVVSNTGYWLYVTATGKQDGFHNNLKFEDNLVSYEGNDSWLEPTLLSIKAALMGENIPAKNEDCEYCKYFESRQDFESQFPHKTI